VQSLSNGSKKYVLDANALVRLYRDTPGAETVDNLIRQAKGGRAELWISAVNLTEVLYVLGRYIPWEQAVRFTQNVRGAVTISSVDEQEALDIAALRTRYKLSLADSCAAELALRLSATLVTADPEFAKLGKRVKVLFLPRHNG
jgi:predicted nucleic acid-binding protein